MIHISIICDALCIDLIKFIINLRRENIITDYVLVAPFSEMHPKRKQQTSIRKSLQSAKVSQLYSFRSLLSNFLNILKIKNLLISCIFYIISKIFNFKFFFLKKNWSLSSIKPFKKITVIYSLEGILVQETIEKFTNGIINIHPAKLPDYRGLDASIWSFIEQKTLGVTAYQIDKGVDTGKVIMFFPLEKKKFTSLREYTTALKILKYNSFAESIKLFHENKFIDTNPMIDKSQNKGLISYEKMLEIKNNFTQFAKF
jgi:hypothetical protein